MGNPNIVSASSGIGDTVWSPESTWRNGGSTTHYAGDTMDDESWKFTPPSGGENLV